MIKMKKFNLKIEQRGQAGAVFRLMIDGIIGIAILMIILGVLTHFNALQAKVSIEEFNTKVIAAAQSPDGSVLSSQSALRLSEGVIFSSNGMQDLTGYPASCFSFNSNRSLIRIKGGGSVAEVVQTTDSKIYVKCSPTGLIASDPDDVTTCEIECIISFGEKLESDFLRDEE